MKIKHIFIAMFRALDCLYDETHIDTLREYLSNANPYVFKDRNSADPSIIQDFIGEIAKKYDNSDIDVTMAYTFVKEYLSEKTEFAELFSDISIDEWIDLCKIVEGENKTE